MEKYKQIIQKQLEEYFEEYKKNSSYSSIIWDAMAYTTLSGGKRLRAIMTLETAKMFKLPIETALPLACSVEIMHAYSLIHDDLPCMDNDDLRRGKPTNHKIYGEAIATLAGDALISFGAQIIIDKTPNNIPKEIVLDIVKDYLVCAGAKGIIAGQVADIKAQDKKGNIENLNYIHKHKTADLFKFAILSSAKLAQVDKKTFEKLEEFALNFGMLFQIYDDIIRTRVLRWGRHCEKRSGEHSEHGGPPGTPGHAGDRPGNPADNDGTMIKRSVDQQESASPRFFLSKGESICYSSVIHRPWRLQ